MALEQLYCLFLGLELNPRFSLFVLGILRRAVDQCCFVSPLFRRLVQRPFDLRDGTRYG